MTKKTRNRSAQSFMVVALASSVLVVACGSEQKPTPPPVEDTAFRDMAGAMDKARAVEDTMKEHKEALDRTLQQNENPTAQ